MSNEIGLLYSQVGYDLGAPKQALVRGPQGLLGKGAEVQIVDAAGKLAWRGELQAKGAAWNTHWWSADFSSLDLAGRYAVRVLDAGKTVLQGEGLTLGPGILFSKITPWMGWRQFEKRRIFGKVAPGWFDAGMLWMEVPSHASAIAGLCDLARLKGVQLGAADLAQTLQQIENGCDYLGLCQDKAEALGKGSCLVHDLSVPRERAEPIAPDDAFMGALAWAKGAEALAGSKPDKAAAYAARACKALDWIEKEARPCPHPDRNMPYNQGWPAGEAWPEQWMTRALMLALWSEILLKAGGFRDREDRIQALSAQILKRQVPQAHAEMGLWGHFYAYDGTRVTEKAWSHGMPEKGPVGDMTFGSDMGAVFAHPLHCFLDGLRLFPRHPLASQWRKACEDFALNYFKPACAQNSFGILPRGVFGQEGLLHFAGLWHGANTLYGQAAALAFEFSALTKDQKFRDVAHANLQWVCGLNAGITKENVEMGCVMRSHDVPEGVALPASMIFEVGERWAGNWTTIRGSVCNGFSTGKQFTYDVAPTRSNDAPSSFTDEDWITHAGGFLMGLARS